MILDLSDPASLLAVRSALTARVKILETTLGNNPTGLDAALEQELELLREVVRDMDACMGSE